MECNEIDINVQEVKRLVGLKNVKYALSPSVGVSSDLI
jgi:hypothetical protein